MGKGTGRTWKDIQVVWWEYKHGGTLKIWNFKTLNIWRDAWWKTLIQYHHVRFFRILWAALSTLWRRLILWYHVLELVLCRWTAWKQESFWCALGQMNLGCGGHVVCSAGLLAKRHLGRCCQNVMLDVVCVNRLHIRMVDGIRYYSHGFLWTWYIAIHCHTLHIFMDFLWSCRTLLLFGEMDHVSWKAFACRLHLSTARALFLSLRCAKYLSIIVHNLFSKCWKTLRGLQLQVAGPLAAQSMACRRAAIQNWRHCTCMSCHTGEKMY